MNPANPAEVRIDKWLWAVRLYKTRTLAAQACRGGHVRIDGQRVKPSRPVRISELISARTGDITRTVKVTALLEDRIGPKLVEQFLEDLTPASEYLEALQRRENRKQYAREHSKDRRTSLSLAKNERRHNRPERSSNGSPGGRLD